MSQTQDPTTSATKPTGGNAPFPVSSKPGPHTFGVALAEMKGGKKAQRPGGRILAFQDPTEDQPLGIIYTEGMGDSRHPYAPSMNDILAEDWIILD